MSVESLAKARKEWHSLTLDEKRQRQIEKRATAIKCWEMYVRDGLSMNQIATKLDLHPAKVSHLIDFAARRVNMTEAVETYTIKLKEIQRLDTLIDSVWKKILPGLEDSEKELTEDDRENLKAYNELTKRKDKLIGLNAPVKMAHQIQRIDAPKTTPDLQEGRLLILIERLMERGRATPEEIAFYQAKKTTPVSVENQRLLSQGGAIGSPIIDAVLVKPATETTKQADITEDKVTEHGQVQLALFRGETGLEG